MKLFTTLITISFFVLFISCVADRNNPYNQKSRNYSPANESTTTISPAPSATATLAPTASIPATPNIPASPSVVGTHGTASGSLTITWTAVPGADSYKIYFNTINSTSGATEIQGITVLSYTINIGLTNGAMYYVFLKASNAYGDSDFSTAASASTLTAPGVYGSIVVFQ